MTLAERLRKISDTRDEEQFIRVTDFRKDIETHKEKQLLTTCLLAAINGRKSISFSKTSLPPQSLKNEGFRLVKISYGYEYHWD